jgi:hypothetical protein
MNRYDIALGKKYEDPKLMTYTIDTSYISGTATTSAGGTYDPLYRPEYPMSAPTGSTPQMYFNY